MDDFTAEIIASTVTPAPESPAPNAAGASGARDSYFTAHSTNNNPSDASPAPSADRDDSGEKEKNRSSRRGGLRGHISALKEKASIQDRLVEKLLQHVIPEEDDEDGGSVANLDVSPEDADPLDSRPNFNITTMSNNFRRFNARIGVVFRFQVKMVRLFSWRKPSHTLSFLAVYTFVCLDPYLIVVLPLVVLLLGVLIPSFMARHPPLAPNPNTQSARLLQSQQYAAASLEYSPRGPPLAPARTVKPVKELSRDFFRNMRDLQNSMEDFSVAHDTIIALVVPTTNFSDESLSSALFTVLVGAFLLLLIAAHLIPWRLAFLVGGWVTVLSGHPTAKRFLNAAAQQHVEPHAEQAQSVLTQWAKSDVLLDMAPETREVEIFELQRRDPSNNEWEPFLFTPSPYDPLSAPRIAGERPRGTRFFEDVMPPEGWAWSEKKWALDLWSRDWVEERIITAVEVETEGERWVYDMRSSYDEKGRDGEPVVEYGGEAARRGDGVGGVKKAPYAVHGPSWEEGEDEDGVGRRGEWRRRRWVRLVKRKGISAAAT